MKKVLYAFVILIGLLQTIGYLSGIKAIRGLGMATCSSPLPIVFTEVKGVETFASDFYIRWTDNKGVHRQEPITPAMYSKLKGPYNRRNIFGAAISYGPVLKEEVWRAVLDYGLCTGVLLEEMGLAADGKNYAVFIITRTAGRDNVWILKPSCTP